MPCIFELQTKFTTRFAKEHEDHEDVFSVYFVLFNERSEWVV